MMRKLTSNLGSISYKQMPVPVLKYPSWEDQGSAAVTISLSSQDLCENFHESVPPPRPVTPLTFQQHL